MPITSAPQPMNPMASMSSVLGGLSVDQGARQNANIADEIRAVMRQIRDLNSQIDGIAQSFPVASQTLDTAKQSLLEAIKAIVANQTGPEPTASPMVG